MNEIITFSPIHLLEKVLEFIEMTPSHYEWSLSSQKQNPPRYVRLLQIESLLKAFFENEPILKSPKIATQIESLLAGTFIRDRDFADYKEVLQFIRDYVSGFQGEIYPSQETTFVNIMVLSSTFSRLLDYKRLLRGLSEFNSGWLEGSGYLFPTFSIHLTESITKKATEDTKDLDKILELLISPKKINFSLEVLEKKFDYPKDNLREIDLDWA